MLIIGLMKIERYSEVYATRTGENLSRVISVCSTHHTSPVVQRLSSMTNGGLSLRIMVDYIEAELLLLHCLFGNALFPFFQSSLSAKVGMGMDLP